MSKLGARQPASASNVLTKQFGNDCCVNKTALLTLMLPVTKKGKLSLVSGENPAIIIPHWKQHLYCTLFVFVKNAGEGAVRFRAGPLPGACNKQWIASTPLPFTSVHLWP